MKILRQIAGGSAPARKQREPQRLATADRVQFAFPQQLTTAEHVRSVCVQDDTCSPIFFDGGTKRQSQPARGQDAGTFAEAFAGQPNVYMSMAGFDYAALPKRKADLARKFKCLWLDIDTRKKEADPGYADDREAEAAWRRWVKATGLKPSIVVHSGHGWHLYFVFDSPISPAQSLLLARRLKRLCELHGLTADHTCTLDAARVLRLPGTVNHKPERGEDKPVVSWRMHRDYTLDKLDELLAPLEADALPLVVDRARLDVNNALGLDSGGFPRTTENERLVQSALDALAKSKKSKTYPRAEWLNDVFALASLDALHDWGGRGAELAVEFSRVTPGYADDADVFKAVDSYDAEKSNAVGIGTLVYHAQQAGWVRPAAAKGTPATQAEGGTTEMWLAETNQHKAVVRWGSGVVILDTQTPTQHADGIRYGPGFLDLAAFRQLLKGRSVIVGGKHEGLADAWLRHPGRRQYEAAVFSPPAPGEAAPPPNVLNLWQGFGIEPRAGDVGAWQELLDALIPDAPVRAYVLRWLAWKVKHPGGVPGTILVVTGGKGAGKNSLFDPVVRMFGAHGRVFDDSEQIAGRFTGHLMTVAFAVLDEALFTSDPRQADRIKSRVTATHMSYEAKGRDPVQGLNRCAYVSLSNHQHVWQATIDERRAVVVEAADGLTGDRGFWSRYYRWLDGGGSAALLHHLLNLDLSDFDVRTIPRSEALRRQVEMTALRDAVVAWWHTVLTEGAVSWRDGSCARSEALAEDQCTTIPLNDLRASFEHAGRRRDGDFAVAMKRLRKWHSVKTARPRKPDGGRHFAVTLPPLPALREEFAAATGVQIELAPEVAV